jgi:YaaC-like Protein
MTAARPITSWRRKGFPAPLNKRILRSSASIRDELIASLDFYSEIKKAGKEILRAKGHTDLANSYARFQAYIRQAKTFFESAENLHHRASPLNYYYSFMNLAKALILLRTPSFVDSNLTHGITQQPTPGSLKKQKIIIRKDGVFPMFYQIVTGHKLTNNATLKITDLLGYTSDVGFEYTKLKFGTSRYYRCKFAIGVDNNKKTAFGIVAVLGAKQKHFEPLKKKIEKNFFHVDFPPNRAREMFDFLAEEHGITGYFEAKTEIPFPASATHVVSNTIASLGDVVSYNPFDDDFLFLVNRPIRTPKLAPMQDFVAIYCCMFFLGSLVRYRPEILEGMLSTKDAWLIERFTNSAPITFLRHIRNLFDNEYLVYTQR